MTGLFVFGFSAVFVALGATATSLSAFLNQQIFTQVAGWVIIGMGLFIAVTAVWSPSLLLPIMRERRVEAHGAQTLGYFGPPVMGAATATVGEGMTVLLFYSLGLGIPFLLTSLLLAKAFSAFDWIKRYLTPITVVSGLLLVGFGVVMVTGRLGQLSNFFFELLDSLGLDSLTTS